MRKVEILLIFFTALTLVAGATWRHAPEDQKFFLPQIQPVETKTIFPEPDSLKNKDVLLIPSTASGQTYEERWLGIHSIDSAYVPLKSKKKKGSLEPLMVRKRAKDKNFWFHTFYSEAEIFTSTTQVLQYRVRDYLVMTLFDQSTSGLTFNPRSRVMSRNIESTYLSKHEIAELIGYLESGPAKLGSVPYSKLALAASSKAKHFQVIYFWQRSLQSPRKGDDWKEAFLEYVQALHHLDYPGSRKESFMQLKWFIDNFGPTGRSLRLYNKIGLS